MHGSYSLKKLKTGIVVLIGQAFLFLFLFFSHEAQGMNIPKSLTVEMGFHCSFVPSASNWVAILILINTSASIKFRIVEMDS